MKQFFISPDAAHAHEPTPKLRVHLGELFRYRATVAATDLGNRVAAGQSAVTSALVALKEDWRQEYLFDQLDRAAARPDARRFVGPAPAQPQLA